MWDKEVWAWSIPCQECQFRSLNSTISLSFIAIIESSYFLSLFFSAPSVIVHSPFSVLEIICGVDMINCLSRRPLPPSLGEAR